VYLYQLFLQQVLLHYKLEMWDDAQRDGRPAEHRWRPLWKLRNCIPCTTPQSLADARCWNAVQYYAKRLVRDGGGRHWLVRMEWHPVGWSMYLPLLIFPCTTKSSSLLASAHPGGPGKRAVKRLWWCCGMPRDWLGRTSPKWPTSCGVGRKINQSINQINSIRWRKSTAGLGQ